MKKISVFIALCVAVFSAVHPEPALARPGYDEGLNQARQQAAAGDYPAAEETLKRLIKKYPKNPEILASLGRIRLWRQDYAGAARLFRKSLSIKNDPSVRQELIRAEALLQLAEADRLLASGETTAAGKILAELFQQKRLPYESGSRLGRLYLRLAQPDKARTVFLTLARVYPAEADFAVLAARAACDLGENAVADDELNALPRAWQERGDVLSLKVRILTAMGRPDEASRLLEGSPQAAATPELKASQTRLAIADSLRQADSLISAGKYDAAVALLLPLREEQSTRYDAAVRLGRIYLAQRDFGRAYEVYGFLAVNYPGERDFPRLAVEALAANGESEKALALLEKLPVDPETLALRGRLQYRMGNLDAAVGAFRESLAGQESETVRQELVTAETAAQLAQAERLAKSGDTAGAVRIWQELDASGRDNYLAGYRLALNAMKQRNYPEARQRLSLLHTRYPKEKEVRALYMETLILNGEEGEAQRLIVALPPAEKAVLFNERPDLLFRVRRNSLKLAGGLFAYTANRPDERDLAVTLTQRMGPLTGVLSGSRVRRFGLTDTQAGLELHGSRGLLPAGSGYLAATFSPDARFLPRYTVGGEYYQGWRGVEGSLGFFRLSFRNSDAHILIPGITLYPAETISLNERLYLVTDTGAVTSLTTLSWEPDHRFRGTYALGIGSAAERFTSSEDTTRFFTLTNRVAGEYRVTPEISFGGELSHEYRQGLYTRAGAILFGRYWW